MSGYIELKMKQLFRDKKYWIRIGITGIILAGLLFTDKFIGMIKPDETIYLKLSPEIESMIRLNGVEFVDENYDAVLKYEDGYVIEEYRKLDEKQLEKIESLLRENDYPKAKVKMRVIEKIEDKDNSSLIVLTLTFFGSLSLVYSVIQQIIEEKNSKVSDFLLKKVSGSQYLAGVMVYKGLKRLLELACFFCFLVIGIIIRNLYDGFKGWDEYIDISYGEIESGINILPVILGILVCGVSVQILFAYIAARAAKNEDCLNYLVLPNLGAVIMFYVLFFLYKSNKGRLWLGFIPFINSLSIGLNAVYYPESRNLIYIMIITGLIYDFILLKVISKEYRRRMLEN